MPTSPWFTRRAIGWTVAAFLVLALFAAGTVLLRSATGLLGAAAAPSPPRITQQVVVERLEAVAKLVSSEMTLRDVVLYDQSRFGLTKRALLVVTGRVSAGIDLRANAAVEIDSVAKRIVIALPPAQILGVDVLDVTTYDERAGLLNPFRPADRDLIQRRVRAQLVEAARTSGILAHADRSAARALEELFAQDGYVVEIRRPPVLRRATE